jgi:protein gp37
MAQLTSIEWTDATWNPITGCTKISPGCKNCYAERMAKRLQSMGQPRYRDGFHLTVQFDVVAQPLTWRKPKTVFVNSMSDLFHEDVPLSYLKKIFRIMEKASWHTFQVLTKRSERLLQVAKHLTWAPNIWMGVSVENEEYLYRIDDLRNVSAAVKFLSIEPLIGPIPSLCLTNVDWVIVGGESGPHSRPIEPDWVRAIRDDCQSAGVPFFFKQWGGTRKSQRGRTLDGRTWDEMPSLRALPS